MLIFLCVQSSLYFFFFFFAAFGAADFVKIIFQSFINTLHFFGFFYLSLLFISNIA